MSYVEIILGAATVVEILGIATMLAGIIVSAVLAMRDLRRSGSAETYRMLRSRLGRGILLGLELLVAADIMRTISEIPSLEKVVILAIIVVIRTFLSFALETEIEGVVPWRRAQRPS